MRRTREQKTNAANRFIREIEMKFPWLKSEVFYDAVPGGGDVLIRSEIDPPHDDDYEAVVHASSHISGLIGDDTGVFIVNMTIPAEAEEAVPHG